MVLDLVSFILNESFVCNLSGVVGFLLRYGFFRLWEMLVLFIGVSCIFEIWIVLVLVVVVFVL